MVFRGKNVELYVYNLGIGQLERNIYVWLCRCLLYKYCGVEGQPWRSLHGFNRWDWAHLSSASRVCFILLFPASDNVAHIMGSCTALRWDRKLIQIVCIGGNDLITLQFIRCSNLPKSCSQIDPPNCCSAFYWVSPKIEFPLTD